MKVARKRTTQTEPIDHHAVSSIFYFAKNISQRDVRSTYVRANKTDCTACAPRYLSMITTFARAIKGQKPCILRKKGIIKVSGLARIFRSRRRRALLRYDGKTSLPNPAAFTFQDVRCDSRMERKVQEVQEVPNIRRTRRIYGRDAQETAIKILF